MVEQRLSLTHKAGLHLRPAATLAQALKPFQATVTISANSKSADARSAVRLMALGATQGAELLIQASGSDEAPALATALQVLSQDLT
jgi:phosphotransferase system HPr (HPr) family protein